MRWNGHFVSLPAGDGVVCCAKMLGQLNLRHVVLCAKRFDLITFHVGSINYTKRIDKCLYDAYIKSERPPKPLSWATLRFEIH